MKPCKEPSPLLRLINLYNALATPLISRLFRPNTCIEQTRIIHDVFTALGATVHPTEATMWVDCPAKKALYITGASKQEREEYAKRADHVYDNYANKESNLHHLVPIVSLQGENYIVEPTLAQASMPNLGLTIKPDVLAIGPIQWPLVDGNNGLEAEIVRPEDGCEVTIRYQFFDSKAYESTPAWEPSHLKDLIDIFIKYMQKHSTM